MTAIPAAARDAAHEAAVARLQSIYSGQVPDYVAREIADAALGAAAPHLGGVAIPDKANCPVCDRPYRTRADGHVRAHNAPRSVGRCDGSPKE